MHESFYSYCSFRITVRYNLASGNTHVTNLHISTDLHLSQNT